MAEEKGMKEGNETPAKPKYGAKTPHEENRPLKKRHFQLDKKFDSPT